VTNSWHVLRKRGFSSVSRLDHALTVKASYALYIINQQNAPFSK